MIFFSLRSVNSQKRRVAWRNYELKEKWEIKTKEEAKDVSIQINCLWLITLVESNWIYGYVAYFQKDRKRICPVVTRWFNYSHTNRNKSALIVHSLILNTPMTNSKGQKWSNWRVLHLNHKKSSFFGTI